MNYFQQLKQWWDETNYLLSEERQELANRRLIAHQYALTHAIPSPYTHPKAYDYRWNYIYSINESS